MVDKITDRQALELNIGSIKLLWEDADLEDLDLILENMPIIRILTNEIEMLSIKILNGEDE